MLLPHKGGLVLGQNLGMKFRYADFFGHGLSGTVAVAGHHNDFMKAQLLKLGNDLLGLLTQRIFNADDSSQRAANGQIQMGILGR